MKKLGSDAFRKATGGLAGLVVVVVIIVAANILVGKLNVRKDLTEEKLYSLSDGTHAMLGKLEKTVTLMFFFNSSSADVPVYLKGYARQVEDLLKEYRIAGGGKIKLETYDPKPDSDHEEWAQRYGLSGQPVQMFGPPIYLGLVAVCGDAEETIPALDPRAQPLLEYNITRLISRLGSPDKPVIGVMSSLPVMGSKAPPFAMPGQPQPPPKKAWLAFQDLGNDYELIQLEGSEESFDSAMDAIVLVHPKNLSDTTLYALDQYVLGGGKLLAFVDPFCAADMESSPAPQYGMQSAGYASDLPTLFSAWGVSYAQDKVLADMRAVSAISMGGNRSEESPVWLSLRKANTASDDILTARLESLMLPFAGTLEDSTSDDLEFKPLLSSSEDSALVNAMSVQRGSQAVRRDFKSSGLEHHFAVRLTGRFKTAFPNGAPAAEDDGAEETAAPPAGLMEGNSSVIVVADVDMLYDRFCAREMGFMGASVYQPINDNLSLLANAVELMSGGSDLVAIRSRGTFQRPFDRVLALEQKAQGELQEKEKEIMDDLQETRSQLSRLQSEKDASQRLVLSPEQERAIEKFRKRELSIARELRDVRKDLRRDIDRLGVKVKAVNILLMPALLALCGIGFGLHRRRSH